MRARRRRAPNPTVFVLSEFAPHEGGIPKGVFFTMAGAQAAAARSKEGVVEGVGGVWVEMQDGEWFADQRGGFTFWVIHEMKAKP